MIDTKGIVQQYNPAAKKLFQYTAKEIIGKNITKLMPSYVCNKHDSSLKRDKKTHETHIIGKNREVQAQKKDGSLCNIFLSTIEVKLGNEIFFTGIISDITEAKMLQEFNQKLINFNLAMIQRLEKIDDYRELIKDILRNFSTLFNFDLGHFYEYDPHQDCLKSSNLFYTNNPSKYQTFLDVTKKTTFKKSVGLPGTAWKKEKAIYYPDILKSTKFVRTKLTKEHLKLQSGLALPVLYNKKFLGVIEFFSDKALTLDANELNLFGNFAKIISALYGQYQESRTLNLLLENCGEGVYGLDAKGITTFVNPRACKILGYTMDELIGSSMHEKIHHTSKENRPYPRKDCPIYKSIHTNKPAYITNDIFWNKRGKAVHVEYIVTPIVENKNVIGGVVSFTDISERKKVQRHLEVITKFQERYIDGERKHILFDEMLNYLLEYTESEYGFIGEVLKDTKNSTYLKTYSINNINWNIQMRALYEENASDELKFKASNQLFLHTIKTKKALILNNLKKNKAAGELPKGPSILNTYLEVPVFASGGHLVAVYGIANRPGGYPKKTLQDLKTLTHAISNVVESSHHYKTIQKMGRFDSLTQLCNRQYFDSTFNDIIKNHQKEKKCFYLLKLDLNKFKDINDTYGEQTGDEILVILTQRIQHLLKKNDIFARVGGDEFIIILQMIEDIDNVQGIITRIFKSIENTYKIQNNLIYCTAHIGIVSYPESGKTAQTLLKHVDFTLNDAKCNHEKWQFYSKQINKRYQSMQKLKEEVEKAFRNERFYLAYQPQIDLKTNKIIGIEALLRLKSSLHKDISPGAFIPIIEKFGNAERLNEYVVKHALKDILLLNQKKPLKLAINISPKVTQIDVHIQTLIKIVQENKTLLDRKEITLEFEITESSFRHGSENALYQALKMAKKSGIDCAMDDFGIDYSSISRLTQYPFDIIKLDQFFTQKLDKKDKKSAKAVINALMQLSKDLKFTILAEGPETKEQVNCLIEMGCQYAQGFYFYKPMPIKEINKLI